MPIRKFSVSRDDNIYQAWPDLVLTDSGKLICIFTECKHHIDREFSRLMMCESTDRGRTWTDKKPFTDYTPSGTWYNNSRISKLFDGRLVVVCDLVAKDENSEAVVHIWLGDAEGLEWSEPVETPARGTATTRAKPGRTELLLLQIRSITSAKHLL